MWSKYVMYHCLKSVRIRSYFRIFVFSRIWTEYGEILRISPYSVRMRKNADQNNSEYGHLSEWVWLKGIRCWHALHKKWSFSLRISLVNVTKAAGNCGFGYINWMKSLMENLIFCAVINAVIENNHYWKLLLKAFNRLLIDY